MPTGDTWIDRFLRVDRTSDEIEKNAAAVKDWCGRMFFDKRTGGTLLVMTGETGTGKTHLAKRASEWLRLVSIKAWNEGHYVNPPSVEFVSWPDVASEMDPAYERQLVAATLLVLDEIGGEVDRYRSGAPVESLRKILGAREGKWTIVTTNETPRHWNERWDRRVADRLVRGSVVLQFKETPSYAIWGRTKK